MDGYFGSQPVLVAEAPVTAGGLTPYQHLDLGVTGRVVKASAGQLYGWALSNAHATDARYVKFYDKATAPTQVDSPAFIVRIPAGALSNVPLPQGIAFANGISVRATTGVADADTGAPTASDVQFAAFYK
jgi:hypothetical protein